MSNPMEELLKSLAAFEGESGKNAQSQAPEILRLAELGKMHSGLVHDLNNQLAMALGYANLISKEENMSPQYKQHLEILKETLTEAARLMNSTLQSIRENRHLPEKISLNEILERSILGVERDLEFKKSGIVIRRNFNENLPEIMADPFQIQRMGTNLIRNAIHAIRESGAGDTILVSTFIEKSLINISIADNGPGIPKHAVARLTEPLFTTRKELGGTGLGLMIVKNVIKAHRGTLTIQNIPQGGALFVVKLPISVFI